MPHHITKNKTPKIISNNLQILNQTSSSLQQICHHRLKTAITTHTCVCVDEHVQDFIIRTKQMSSMRHG